jgi:hypothetical protein
MGARTIVTFGTDGFTDYVKVPEGSTYNLGSLSVLNFVASLAESKGEAKRALDTFLTSREATLAVDRDAMVRLLAPRRALWAREGEDFMDAQRLANVAVTLNQLDERVRYLEAHGESTIPFEKVLVAKTAAEVVSLASKLASEAGAEDSAPETPKVDEGEGKTAAIDNVAFRELELFMENDSSFDRPKTAILRDVLRAMKANAYDPKAATKAWLPLVDQGAKEYARETDVDAGKMFPKPLREQLARGFAAYYAKAIEMGEFDHLKVASEEAPEEQGKEAQQKTSYHASAVALTHVIGRGLDKLAGGKVPYAERVTQDLHRLASDLREALTDIPSAERSSRLASLARRAEHVRSYLERAR